MQSNDLSQHTADASRTRFGNWRIGCQRRFDRQHARVPAHSDPNARKRERPTDHVGYYGKRNSQQCRAEGRSVVEFAFEG